MTSCPYRARRAHVSLRAPGGARRSSTEIEVLLLRPAGWTQVLDAVITSRASGRLLELQRRWSGRISSGSRAR